ncbi:MAG: replicative DNA helicase [Nitrospiraceae bacterium]|nr:replicative DNA helicase [Nitrospiraceae bacterium]
MLNKIPPHNIEAEQSVLGSIILEPDCLLDVSDTLSAQDFYKETHRKIFNALLDVYQLEGKADIIAVSERLASMGELGAVGGNQYLASLAINTPSAANIKHHAKIVKDKATIRSISRFTAEMHEKSYSGEVQPLLLELEHGVIGLAETVKGKKSPKATDIIQSLNEQWALAKSGKQTFVPAPSAISDPVPGAFPGHMWLICGYTSAGKSTFLAQLMASFMRKGERPLIFSTEDSREEKMMKLIANLADVPQRLLLTGRFIDREAEVGEATDLLEMWDPIIYDDIWTPEEMRLKIKKHKLQDGVRIVALDYVQNLKGTGDFFVDMRHAATSLYATFREMGVTGIVHSKDLERAVP